MGVKSISIDSMGFLKLILSTFMFTYFYASLSSFIAIKTKVSELMATFIHLFNLPIIFTSTALVPNKNLPIWIEQIAKYNPLSHLSNILRESIVNTDFDNGNTTFSFLLLGILTLISFFCLTHYFKTINYD
jgi:ABC-2 type transport system permease protein